MAGLEKSKVEGCKIRLKQLQDQFKDVFDSFTSNQLPKEPNPASFSFQDEFAKYHDEMAKIKAVLDGKPVPEEVCDPLTFRNHLISVTKLKQNHDSVYSHFQMLPDRPPTPDISA